MENGVWLEVKSGGLLQDRPDVGRSLKLSRPILELTDLRNESKPRLTEWYHNNANSLYNLDVLASEKFAINFYL